MLLDDLKSLIKDFEGILSKDLRFKEDMYFKNQVKVIYGQKEKTKNVFVPLMLANLSKTTEVDEKTKLKDRIKYLEKIVSLPDTHVCPKVEPQDCSKCATHVCPKVEPHVCPKVEPHVCPKVEPHVCPKVEPHVCPPCNCPKYEAGELPDSDTIRKAYNDVTRRIETTSSEEDELNTVYEANNGDLKRYSIQNQIDFIKELLPDRFKDRSDEEIKERIIKFQK